MSWKRLGGLLALLLVMTGGCKQRCFMTEADYNKAVTVDLQNFELAPGIVSQPITNICEAPPTLNNLDRKIRYVSLHECISIALESGRVGQPSLLFPGTALDNLVQFTGNGVSGSDAIRVFAIDPARVGAELEKSLTKFDAVFLAAMDWATVDVSGGQFQQGLSGQYALGRAGVLKALPTGGVAGITFEMPYQYLAPSSTQVGGTRVNPSYTPSLQFQFEQPLLQGFGAEINQLRSSHPGSVNTGAANGAVVPPFTINQAQTPGYFSLAPTQEGILITRLRYDQQRADFERSLNQMLLNVETAYWNLYGAYWTLYSREQGLRFAFEVFKLNKLRLEAGKLPASDFYQSRGQYEQFRAQRLQAIDQLLERERQLRGLLGIPIEDGTRLMPSDSPTLAPYLPDWKMALEEALTKRPELFMARQDVKAAQMNLILAKNSLLPDLRFRGTYDVNALGTRLDGASGSTLVPQAPGGTPNFERDINAFRGLAENNFNNWSAGLTLTIPLGNRLAYANVRQAQLGLARSLEVLKDQELKAQSFLASYYRRLSTNYETIRANRAQREAFGEQLRVRYQEYSSGRGNLDVLLEAQRFWAEALSQEYQSIVDYNNALVGLEFAKGTIQQHNNINIAEGALPEFAAARAVDHFRQRTAAFVLRERASPSAVTPTTRGECANGRAPSLPAVMAAVPPMKEVPALPKAIEAMPPTLPSPVPFSQDELSGMAKPNASPAAGNKDAGQQKGAPGNQGVPDNQGGPKGGSPEKNSPDVHLSGEKPNAENKLPQLYAPARPAPIKRPTEFGTVRDPE